ncbi:hypothetical protein [Arthrobacter sp. 260]|uniref:hypothetical protein n=1 Tax=Arthrobacter sp. 260 TaxID=2735314 RepID=UPI0014914354|nr:hypothetical protein [Arthrobacter sp. 260]NOJ60386.1 hypothetical protein [Arthrobacter sp. 260]
MVNYDENIWFTHSSAAARQAVDVLQGRKVIPHDLRKAALETHLTFPTDMASACADGNDVAVVEVSTLRRHHVQGVELNAHKVYGIAAESGVAGRSVVQGNVELLPDGHILRDMQVAVTSYDDLKADLVSIASRLDCPVLAVDHLYSELPDGSPVPERLALTQALSGVASETSVDFLSTKAKILEIGLTEALTDQNHYRPGVEADVGRSLLDRIRSLVN